MRTVDLHTIHMWLPYFIPASVQLTIRPVTTGIEHMGVIVITSIANCSAVTQELHDLAQFIPAWCEAVVENEMIVTVQKAIEVWINSLLIISRQSLTFNTVRDSVKTFFFFFKNKGQHDAWRLGRLETPFPSLDLWLKESVLKSYWIFMEIAIVCWCELMICNINSQ